MILAMTPEIQYSSIDSTKSAIGASKPLSQKLTEHALFKLILSWLKQSFIKQAEEPQSNPFSVRQSLSCNYEAWSPGKMT